VPAIVSLAGMPYLCHHHWAECSKNLTLKSAAEMGKGQKQDPLLRRIKSDN